MKSPIPDYLLEVVESTADDRSGRLADYIPPLAAVEPDVGGLALSTVDGTVYAVGDADLEFTIQSISKPFVYAIALAQHGIDKVLRRVGVEPSGEAFHELSLESGTGRPLNPMINAGALTTHQMIGGPGTGEGERNAQVLDALSRFAGRELKVDEEIYEAEVSSAHRNHAIAYMLRSHENITGDPREVVRGYVRQCAVRVTVTDLALMAATLAHGGVQPVTGERVVSRAVARQVLSVMTTCGMYDAAGDWLSTIGIPAKSGVSGGIIGSLPGQAGVATVSPRLDDHGTSVRGVKMFRKLSHDMGMHLMEVPAPARTMLTGDDGDAWRYELQGSINFVGMERVVRTIDEDPPEHDRIVIDLTRVHEVRKVGRRMLHEAIRRLVLEGREVEVHDPDGLLAEPGPIEVGEDPSTQEPVRVDVTAE